MAGTNPRSWPGLDPVEPNPQPSRPSPAFGAPDIGQRHTSKEDPVLANDDPKGDYSANGGYGHRPITTPPPQNPPAE
jgi:hypothetical protein